MSDPVRINGNTHSWGSIIPVLAGSKFYGFTSISYGDKRERVKGYGAGRHHAPTRRSSGKYGTDPVKLGGFKTAIEQLRTELAARSPDGRSYGNVQFTIQIQFFEPGDIPMNVVLEGCVVVGDTTSHEESADPLKDEIEIDCMKIKRNGKYLFDGTGGQP